jgi:hypothetical protein
MSKGNDIPTSVLNTHGNDWFEEKGSKLYTVLNDVDRASYVKYILKSGVMHLWRNAPGGYAPFFFEKSFKLAFASLQQIDCIESTIWEFNSHSKVAFDLSKTIAEIPEDISALYDGLTQSPLFPVFRYENKNEPKFVFLQLDGRYQIIYGRNGVIHPLSNWNMGSFYGPVSLDKNTLQNMVLDLRVVEGKRYSIDAIPTLDKKITDLLMPMVEGFKTDKINNEYALYFPDKTQTKELREKSRVLIMGDYNSNKDVKNGRSPNQSFSLDGKTLADRKVYYNFSNLYYSVVQQFEGRTGDVVKVDDGTKRMLHSDEKFLLLLPIDYSKVSSGNSSLVMGSSFGASNLIDSTTYNVGTAASIHQT